MRTAKTFAPSHHTFEHTFGIVPDWKEIFQSYLRICALIMSLCDPNSPCSFMCQEKCAKKEDALIDNLSELSGNDSNSNRTNLLLMVICGLLALLVVFQVIKCMWWAYNHYCKQSKSSISMEKICDFDSDLEIQQEAKKIRIMNWI
eukprot:957680_1